MKILVFANKKTGYNCLAFLLENFDQDEYLVFISKDSIPEIQELLIENKTPHHFIDQASLTKVLSMPEQSFDWLLNLWGSYIFKKEILAKAKKSLNIHPSLLPYGRGMDPIVWALRHRFPAGVSLHSITEGIDEGPIWVQEEVKYQNNTRGEELYERCLVKATSLFCESWPQLRVRKTNPSSQKKIKNQKTFKRKEFIEESFTNLDNQPDIKDFIFKVQAHDFSGDYKLKVRLGGEDFLLSLNLKKLE